MDDKSYSMAFTTGGLFRREAGTLAELYLQVSDWGSVRERVIADNLLQSRTISSLKRVTREVVLRLETLNRAEIQFLHEEQPQEQAFMLWVAVCRRYSFIAEFAVEVLRERFITMRYDVSYEDFDSFFNRQAEWHDELDVLTTSTRAKLRQCLFKMLREAGLISEDRRVQPAMPGLRLRNLLRQRGKGELLYFPLHENVSSGAVQ